MQYPAPMAPTTAPLRTERLELVLFSDQHLDTLHALWTEPDVRRYLWDDRIISRQEVAGVIEASRASFEQDGLGFWVLVLSGSKEPVGFAGLRGFDDAGEVEILYGLAPNYWRRGLATEAARRVLRFAFEDLELEEVFAGADPPNIRSFRVMERLGFKLHSRRILEGVETDYYSLTRQQYRSLDAPGSDS